MKNILIVDDSALMRRTMSDIINSDEELHNEKYAVNGEDALRLLDAGNKFDAIVLDINMPKMNGIEFLRVLNKQRRREKVVIVSTVAKEGGKETIQALELGAFDFVTKPDSLSEVKGPSFSQRLIEVLYAAVGLRTSETSNEDAKRRAHVSKLKTQTARHSITVPKLPEHTEGIVKPPLTKMMSDRTKHSHTLLKKR